MNKIYNNLSIENLTKTDWINQFDEDQKIQIRWGLAESLDVSIYAKTNISAYKMEEIRKKKGKEINVILGEKTEELEKAKKEFDFEKIEELILDLKNLSVL